MEENTSRSINTILIILSAYLELIHEVTSRTELKKVMKNKKHRKLWKHLSAIVPSLKKLLANKTVMSSLDDIFGDFSGRIASIVATMD